MLLLFVVAAFADYAMVPGASEAQATRRFNQHDDCVHTHGAVAQWLIRAEQQHLSFNCAHRGR
jgi:hypothetical protein